MDRATEHSWRRNSVALLRFGYLRMRRLARGRRGMRQGGGRDARSIGNGRGCPSRTRTIVEGGTWKGAAPSSVRVDASALALSSAGGVGRWGRLARRLVWLTLRHRGVPRIHC